MAIATGGLIFGEEALEVKLEDVQLHDFGQVSTEIFIALKFVYIKAFARTNELVT